MLSGINLVILTAFAVVMTLYLLRRRTRIVLTGVKSLDRVESRS